MFPCPLLHLIVIMANDKAIRVHEMDYWHVHAQKYKEKQKNSLYTKFLLNSYSDWLYRLFSSETQTDIL